MTYLNPANRAAENARTRAVFRIAVGIAAHAGRNRVTCEDHMRGIETFEADIAELARRDALPLSVAQSEVSDRINKKSFLFS